MKILILLLINILVVSIYSQKTIANDINCNSKKIASLLDELSYYDVIHNCNINVSKYTEVIRQDGLAKKIVFNYKVEVQDNYLCSNYSNKCNYEMYEVSVPERCMLDSKPITENFVYQRRYNIRNETVKDFAQAKFDYFNNLIYFSLGEISNLSSYNHRIVCKPQLFGGNI